MPEEEKKVATGVPVLRERSEHPWIEMPADDGPDEVVRYSLDEIRF